MKECIKCKQKKPFDQFYKRTSSVDGYRKDCIECNLANKRAVHIKYKNERNRKCREYDAAHLKEKTAYNKQYYADHREERIKTNYAYQKEQRKLNNNYALADKIRCRLYQAVRFGQKAGSAVADLGCTIPELRSHLESKFKPGMTWDNWSKNGWHIDHIKPLASFNLEDREQFLEAVHFSNLQPLWASENIHKSAKV